MLETDALQQAIDEIRISDAVVVLGAGASYAAGMPLAGQLSSLVWHTLDQHIAVRQRIASTLRLGDSAAKGLIGDDPTAVRIAFKEIGIDQPSRNTFQRAFASLDRDRRKEVSGAHEALARLVYAGRALRAVSLNWDTLLEASFERRYGAGINAQERVLWKAHGDCGEPTADWILPSEDGFVSDEIVADLELLARERPRVLLIVGYSERDDTVLRRLVDPLAGRWRVYRLSRHALGEGAIKLSPNEGLIGMAEALCPSPEMQGWEFVSFDHQRGIEAAVSGERLGPRDVDSCPRLPHFASARRALDIVNQVDIAGPSGCGKSITAWQLARELNKAGWHVLRARTPQAENILLSSLKTNRWKSVAVVDDAQTFGSTFVERLNELANPRLAVITGTTDASGEQPRSVRIPAQVAVETLANDFRKRRDELLPIVKKFDSRIGDEYMATPIEWRLDDAAKSTTPWQFAFVLRGGWTLAREQFNTLRDFDRADLLLVLIAARQLLSLDAGSELETIVSDAQAMGRSERWALTGIELLRRQGAVLPGLPLRCLHIQSAIIVVGTALKRRDTDAFQLIVASLRRMVYDPHTSVRGIYWLNEHVLGADAFRYSSSRDEDAFFECPQLEQLVKRLFTSTAALARRDAAFVLSRLLWYRELDKERLSADFSTLREWLETATGENCYALGDLVNCIRYGSDASYEELVSSMDPSAVWRRVETLDASSGYSWGHFLNCLAFAGGSNWRMRAVALVDRNQLFDLIDTFTVGELAGLSEFIEGLASLDRDLGLEAVRRAIPTLKAGFRSDAFEAYRAVSDLEHRVLGHPLFDQGRPSKSQNEVSRQIADSIRPDNVATGIESCRFGDWETYARLLHFVQRVNREKHRAIVAAISWDALERRCVEFWRHPPREFRLLLSNLATRKNGEPVRAWIFQHSKLIQEIDPIFTGLSPESAVAVLGHGGRVNLAGHNESVGVSP